MQRWMVGIAVADPAEVVFGALPVERVIQWTDILRASGNPHPARWIERGQSDNDTQPAGSGGLEHRVILRPVPVALTRLHVGPLQKDTHEFESRPGHRPDASLHLFRGIFCIDVIRTAQQHRRI